MNSSSAVSRLALLQFLVVTIGVLTTCAMLRIYQYGPETAVHPEPGMRWNPVAVAVRSYGISLLIVPAAWMIGCLALERRMPQFWSRGWTISAGIVMLASLIGLLAWTTICPYFFEKVPLREWGY